MEAINLTQLELTDRFKIEVQKFNAKHLLNLVNEALEPEAYGTELIDVMAAGMKPHTESDIFTITAVLHVEILKEAAARWRKDM